MEAEEVHHIALPALAKLVGYDSHDMDYLKEAHIGFQGRGI